MLKKRRKQITSTTVEPQIIDEQETEFTITKNEFLFFIALENLLRLHGKTITSLS
jgi:hypothetical protein